MKPYIEIENYLKTIFPSCFVQVTRSCTSDNLEIIVAARVEVSEVKIKKKPFETIKSIKDKFPFVPEKEHNDLLESRKETVIYRRYKQRKPRWTSTN